MKKLIVILACFFCMAVKAQKAEKIYGNARQHKPVSYYKEQSAAWKKIVDANPKDAAAWYNYYYANRNIMFNDTAGAITSEERYKRVQKIVKDMGKSIPDSYEYNMCKWQMSGHDPKYISYLNKAVELGEGRVEHLDYMINQGELERRLANRDLYSVKKFEAGQFSTGIIYYNYNVLMGLEKNAILLTGGDNDTYPIWYLQARGIRKDVTVLNMSLIMLDDYREKIFKELGIEALSKSLSDEAIKGDKEEYRNSIVTRIAANTQKHPVCVALTTACDDRYTKTIQANLYLTGLSYLYSKEPVDNVAFIRKNVEQVYALDYLDKSFYTEISPDIVKIINGNYLVPLLTLYDHYKLAGDISKSDWVKTKILLIAKGTEHEEDVLKHFAKLN